MPASAAGVSRPTRHRRRPCWYPAPALSRGGGPQLSGTGMLQRCTGRRRHAARRRDGAAGRPARMRSVGGPRASTGGIGVRSTWRRGGELPARMGRGAHRGEDAARAIMQPTRNEGSLSRDRGTRGTFASAESTRGRQDREHGDHAGAITAAAVAPPVLHRALKAGRREVNAITVDGECSRTIACSRSRRGERVGSGTGNMRPRGSSAGCSARDRVSCAAARGDGVVTGHVTERLDDKARARLARSPTRCCEDGNHGGTQLGLSRRAVVGRDISTGRRGRYGGNRALSRGTPYDDAPPGGRVLKGRKST